MNKQSFLNGIFFLSTLIFFGSCSKTPDDPESFAEQAFATFQEDDYESFEKMTVASLTFSEFESIFTNFVERRKAFVETKVEEASGEEKEKWKGKLEKIKERMEEGELEKQVAKEFLRMTFHEIEFEEWQEFAKLLKDDKGESKSSKSDYNEWKDGRPKDNKAKMKKYFERVISEAKTAGINWEEATFEGIKVDEEKREEVDDYDLEILIKHDDKELGIELECIDTNQGILIIDEPRLMGLAVDSRDSNSSL
jgi:hypothetical protein